MAHGASISRAAAQRPRELLADGQGTRDWLLAVLTSVWGASAALQAGQRAPALDHVTTLQAIS